MPDELVTIGPWPKGIDNRNPEERIAPDALVEAENIDLDTAGVARSRGGYTQRIACTSAHSLCSVGGLLLRQEGGQIISTEINGFTDTVLADGLSPTREVAYTEAGGDVYLTNGEMNIKIRAGQAGPWGIPTPGMPNVSQTTGTLTGDFLVAVSFEMADGSEGGVSEAVQVTMAGEGLQLSSLPAWSSAYARNIYLSKPNGEVLYWVGHALTGETSFEISAQPIYLEDRSAERFEQMPPGQAVCTYAGRIFVASGEWLYWSEPNEYHVYRPVGGMQRFRDYISVLDYTDDGLWVVAGDRTYFVAGADPAQFQVRYIAHLGAAEGSQRFPAAYFPALQYGGMAPFWASDHGLVAGLPSGNLVRLTEGRVVMDRYQKAALLYREDRGIRQLLTAFRNRMGASSGLHLTDRAECVIKKQGVAE